MTTEEFNTQFDIYYNNISSNAAPPINAYEKSVFLTQSQLDVVLEIYSGRGVTGLSFESTEEARKYLSSLIKKVEIDITDKDQLIKLPDDVLVVTLEECIFNDDKIPCLKGTSMKVYPVTQDDLHNILNNPFRGPNKNKVLRVDIDNKIKLYSNYNISKYIIYYVKIPNPIIIENLTEYGLSIQGKTNISESDCNPILHRYILERAVSTAKAVYSN